LRPRGESSNTIDLEDSLSDDISANTDGCDNGGYSATQSERANPVIRRWCLLTVMQLTGGNNEQFCLTVL
jgi:hypothetical protein